MAKITSKPAEYHRSAFHPNMMMVITFFATLIVNMIVAYVANMWFPQHVVLGTQSMNTSWAILHSMGTLALFLTLAMPFMTELEKKKGSMLTPIDWMTAYFVLNVVGLWLITRCSDQFGLGVSSWLVVVGIAVVLDFLQGMVMMAIGEKTKAK